MAIEAKLTEEDLALVEVIEDPIFLSEFLRSTGNGDFREGIKHQDFELHWYQKDILTDLTEHILIRGGRSVGKCQPDSARILTDKGYKTIKQLKDKYYFTAVCLDDQGNHVLRRASILKDLQTKVFRLSTETRSTLLTENHPVLTQRGYVKVKDLKESDLVAVATRIPEPVGVNLLKWHEMRYFGYICFEYNIGAENRIPLRFPKGQLSELQQIVEAFKYPHIKLTRTSEYAKIERTETFVKHPYTWTLVEMGLKNGKINGGIRRIPEIIMQEPNESVKVFIGSMLSRYANLSTSEISFDVWYIQVARDLQELFLRFGIDLTFEQTTGWRYGKERIKFILRTRTKRDVYRVFTTFDIAGVSIGRLPLPPPSFDHSDTMRFEKVVSVVQQKALRRTYAVFVDEFHNYIADNIHVHNTVILQDKIVHEVVNADIEFPEESDGQTGEVLATANKNQLTPLFNKLASRFTTSPLLKYWLNNNLNRSDGLFQFNVHKPPHMIYARIAGSNGESNMVGLHVSRFRIDEVQLFPPDAFTQLKPAYNSWQAKRQQMAAGVPNGLRTSVMYILDQKTPRWKKYRIPSPNNPNYSREQNIEDIKEAGGVDTDTYQQLVLGDHGSPTAQLLAYEDFKRENFKFHSIRYNGNEEPTRGKPYECLDFPALPANLVHVVLAVDPGFVDPCICVIAGFDGEVWRSYIRYRLERTDYPIQEKFIDVLDDHYHFNTIGIDIGAGGQGGSFIQSLQTRPEYKHKNYEARLVGVNNTENVILGTDSKVITKNYASEQLVKHIQSHFFVFSEMDVEATDQLARLAKKKTINGNDQYFILGDRGGKSKEDHIYAAYVVLTMAIRDMQPKAPKKRLGRSNVVIL